MSRKRVEVLDNLNEKVLKDYKYLAKGSIANLYQKTEKALRELFKEDKRGFSVSGEVKNLISEAEIIRKGSGEVKLEVSTGSPTISGEDERWINKALKDSVYLPDDKKWEIVDYMREYCLDTDVMCKKTIPLKEVSFENLKETLVAMEEENIETLKSRFQEVKGIIESQGYSTSDEKLDL